SGWDFGSGRTRAETNIPIVTAGWKGH
ncbi:MAG: hypothetical protein OGMRLDGQ_001604, partial [Candidatus Fervidibacter sp.]